MTAAKQRPALELRVYPLCTDPSCPADDDLAHYAEPCGLYQWHADEKAAEKQLTDPELAAEYWRATSDILDPRNPVEPAVTRRRQMEKFATLPHASENGYE